MVASDSLILCRGLLCCEGLVAVFYLKDLLTLLGGDHLKLGSVLQGSRVLYIFGHGPLSRLDCLGKYVKSLAVVDAGLPSWRILKNPCCLTEWTEWHWLFSVKIALYLLGLHLRLILCMETCFSVLEVSHGVSHLFHGCTLSSSLWVLLLPPCSIIKKACCYVGDSFVDWVLVYKQYSYYSWYFDAYGSSSVVSTCIGPYM